MIKTLEERLGVAKAELKDIEMVLAWPSETPLGQKSKDEFSKLVGFGQSIDGLIEIMQARATALQFLEGLEDRADAEDRVPFGATKIKFQNARLLGVLSYLTTLWSLADQITSFAGRVLCTPKVGRNGLNGAKLVGNFSLRNGDSAEFAGVLLDSINEKFSSSLRIAYALRNHFIHDGAQRFFESPRSSGAFRISSKGWDGIVKQNGVEKLPPDWPQSPCDDLREILRICEREMDAVLGVLLGSACGLFRAHVEFMLGVK